MSGPAGPGARRPAPDSGLQVVVFRVGKYCFAAARQQVRAIRESPRVRSRLRAESTKADSLPLVSLSAILGLDRDSSVDRRVLEVEHWGQRLGLEVTSIEGIRDLATCLVHPLPAIAQRNLRTVNVLGLLEWLPSSVEAGRRTVKGGGAAGRNPDALGQRTGAAGRKAAAPGLKRDFAMQQDPAVAALRAALAAQDAAREAGAAKGFGVPQSASGPEKAAQAGEQTAAAESPPVEPPSLALDLTALLIEQGVDVPTVGPS